jgi:branched-chain amino acid transport system substrate-binding protein
MEDIMSRLVRARRFATTLAGVLAVAACGGGAQTSSSTMIDLPVAAVMPFTGAASSVGTPITRGFELGINDINAHGGVTVAGKTYRLVLKIEDDATIPDQAVALIRKHLDSADTKIIYGPDSTPETLPVVEIMKNRDVFNISCCSGTFASTLYHDPSKYPNIVSMQSVTQQHQGCYLPTFVSASKAKKVAALLNNNPTGQLVAKNLPTYLGKQGIEPSNIDIQFFPSNTTDFTPILTKIAAKNPELAILGVFTQPPVTILRQANDLGLTSKMVFAGTEGAGISDPVTATGKQLENWMWPQLGPAFDSGNTTLERARQLWKQKYNEDPANTPYLTSVIFLGWDGAHMLKLALEKGGSVSSPAAMVKGWKQIGSYKGINTNHVSPDGVGSYDEQVGQIKGGKATYIDCPTTPVAVGSV